MNQEVAGGLQAEVRLLLLEGAPEEGAGRLALDPLRDHGGDRHPRGGSHSPQSRPPRRRAGSPDEEHRRKRHPG